MQLKLKWQVLPGGCKHSHPIPKQCSQAKLRPHPYFCDLPCSHHGFEVDAPGCGEGESPGQVVSMFGSEEAIYSNSD